MNDRVLNASINDIVPIIKETVSAGKDVTIISTGGSMRPLWHDRKNNITLTACDPQALKRGDVPLFCRDNGTYVIHRIAKVYEDSFEIVGDAQYITERVDKSSIIAVVKSFSYHGKTVGVTNTVYRMYSSVWLWLLPVRRYIFAIVRRIKKLFKH